MIWIQCVWCISDVDAIKMFPNCRPRAWPRGPRAVSRFNFTWTQEARRLYSINGRPYTPGRERVVRLGAAGAEPPG